MTWEVRPGRVPELPLLPDIERAAATLFPQGRVPDPNAAHGVAELQGYLDEGLLWVASGENHSWVT